MKTVDEYIASKPDEAQPNLMQLRAIISKELPEATEAIKWNQPAFLHASGMILVTYSAHKQQTNVVVTPSAKEHFADKLEGYPTGKGSVQIPHDRSVTADLVAELVRERLREYVDDGVKWK